MNVMLIFQMRLQPHDAHLIRHGIASAHIEELSAALPGVAEAMAWPG